MPLSSTTVKAQAEKLELAKLKGINVSKVFRDALDTSLRVIGDDRDMLESQLTDIRKQMEILQLEEKLVLDQLKTLESRDVVNQYREDKFNQWKKNMAIQVKNKTIDWNVIKKLFRFTTMTDCKTWITRKLRAEALI